MDVQFISDPFAVCAYIMSYVVKDEQNDNDNLLDALRSTPPDTPLARRLHIAFSAVMRKRTVCKQEAVCIIRKWPLFKSSREHVFIPTFVHSKREMQSITVQQVRVLARAKVSNNALTRSVGSRTLSK